MKLHVAVVDRGWVDYRRIYGEDPHVSERPQGDWASFVGEDRSAVIRRALEARKKWGLHYRVLVGELTAEVREPVSFEEVPL